MVLHKCMSLITVSFLTLALVNAGCAKKAGDTAVKETQDKGQTEMAKTEAAPEAKKAAAPTTTPAATPQTADFNLTVVDATIAKGVASLTPTDPGKSFTADVNTLYCFTKVLGANDPTHINHVWYYKGEEVANVQLNVKSSVYRTYSTKKIDNRAGDWKVAVTDPNGKLLTELSFQVQTQAAAPATQTTTE